MQFINLVIILLTTFTMWSCNDNGNKPPVIQPPNITQLEIFGILMNSMDQWSITARVYGGDVYGIDQLLFVGSSDVYTIISTLDNQQLPVPTLLEVTSGRYNEVVGNSYSDFENGDKLLACINVRGVNQEQANISFLSTISAGLLRYKSLTNDFGNVYNIISSNDEIANYIGFEYLTTNFVDTTDVINQPTTLTSELKHSLLNASISQWTYDLSIEAGNVQRVKPYRTVDFITIAYQDIAYDGLLNGVGDNGQQLFLGFKLINEISYSHSLAVSLMKYMEDSNNKVILTKKDVLDFAVYINDQNSVTTIDEGGPIITEFLPTDGLTVSGNQEFRVTVEDLTGIDSIEFLIDGLHYSNYGFLSSSPLKTEGNSLFFVPVFQPPGTIGSHFITVKVTNIYGTTTEVTNNVTFDNI